MKSFLSFRARATALAVSVATLAAAVVPLSAADAQFSFGRSRSNDADRPQNNNGCEAQSNSVGRSILRGALGAATSRLGRVGNIARFVPSAAVADTLTNVIACRLDDNEQVKAKDATDEVTATETVGSSVAWRSDTRENVTGTSTIVAVEDQPASAGNAGVGGYRCMFVDDVIIINGEETREQKRMCRVPPSTRYTLAA
jgi:surface antigen